jgi:hypothetical protein
MNRPARFDFGPGEPPHGTYIFGFGKHKGTPITDVDRGYLEWLLDKPDILAKSFAVGLEDAINAEIARRGKEILKREVERHTAPSRYDELTMEYARLIVEAGAEQLAEMMSADLKFTAAYSFLKNQIALEEVNDGTLVL